MAHKSQYLFLTGDIMKKFFFMLAFLGLLSCGNPASESSQLQSNPNLSKALLQIEAHKWCYFSAPADAVGYQYAVRFELNSQNLNRANISVFKVIPGSWEVSSEIATIKNLKTNYFEAEKKWPRHVTADKDAMTVVVSDKALGEWDFAYFDFQTREAVFRFGKLRSYWTKAKCSPYARR